MQRVNLIKGSLSRNNFLYNPTYSDTKKKDKGACRLISTEGAESGVQGELLSAVCWLAAWRETTECFDFCYDSQDTIFDLAIPSVQSI